MKEDEQHLKKLVLLAKNGDEVAFEEIYRSYYTPLYRYVLMRTKNKDISEEMVQDIFLKIFKYLPNWKENHTSPASFFFTVARNTLIDHFRKDKGKIIFSDEIVLRFAEENGSDDKYKEELSVSILEAVAKLSEDQQEIITLFYTNDLTYKEISEITGKKEEAIRQTHSRAIKKLREIYKI